MLLDQLPVLASVVASAVASVCSSFCEQQTGVKKGFLGKNRATPGKPHENDSKRTPPNRALIRVAVASRLMAMNWRETDENLKGSSVMGCGRWKNYGSDPNIAEIEVVGETPRMLGHLRCKAVWSCEHCAPRRVAQTRSWLRAELMPALEAENLSASLVTFTLSHSYEDDWSKVVDDLARAYTLMDRNVKDDYIAAGSVGKLKSLEATVGKNGLHPHFHVLLTHAKDADLKKLAARLEVAWVKAVVKVGGRCTDRGFDFKENCINDYVAKMESAHELASHSTKTSRQKGKTLGQLLDRFSIGDQESGKEWIRAQAALGGRVRFHAGNLPKKLNISCPSEWEDEDRAEELKKKKESEPEPIRITYPQPQHLKATGTTTDRAGLAIILRSARGGNAEKVLRTVDALCANVDAIADSKYVTHTHHVNVDDAFDVMQAAHQRILTPEEVEIYLRARR